MENSTPVKSSLIKSSSSVKLGALNGLWSLVILGGTLFALNSQLDISGTFNKFKISILQQLVDSGVILSIEPDTTVEMEGNTGTSNFEFKVSRSNGDGTIPLTVQYKVTGSGPNPASATDFIGNVFPSGTVMFPAGNASQTISIFIPVKGETLLEAHEQFTVTLCNPIPGNDTASIDFSSSSAPGIIENDDNCDLIPNALSTNTDSICVGDTIDISAIGRTMDITEIILIFKNEVLVAGTIDISQAEILLSTVDTGTYCLYSLVYDIQPVCNLIPQKFEDITDCFTSCFALSPPLCITIGDFCQFTGNITNINNTACSGPTGSFTVEVQDAVLCQGVYTVVATPIAGTGPGGSTPPVIPIAIFSGFGEGGFLFASAGAGRYAISVTETSGCGGPINPLLDSVDITLLEAPTSAIQIIGSDTICEGGGDTVKIEISASGGTGPYDFFLNDIILGFNGCNPIGSGGTSASLDDTVITLCFTNLTAGSITVNIDSVADANGCYDITKRSVTITILPKPKGKDGSKMIESCVEVDYDLTDSIDCSLPSTFSWYAVQSIGSNIPYDNPNVTGETVNPPGTDSIINDVLINITNVNQTIYYYVLPTSLNGCVGDSFYVSVTVKPAVINLVAHDQVNISMDENCMKVVIAGDVVKNAGLCGDLLTEITIVYPFGTQTYSPANKLDRTHLGYCMVFSVKDIITGNTTWGKLCVEDKKGPELACEADTVTCFEVAQLPQGSYTVKDNCANAETKVLVASVQYIDYGCHSFYQGKVIRHLVATDPWGNTKECHKEFYIKRITLDSIVCPRDTLVDCSLETITIKDIKVSFKDPLRSGFPKIKTKNGLVSLWPNNASCKLTVSPPIDEYYPICGAGYKVRRTWRITDWCTGAEKLCVQWIEVVDKTAPVATNKTLPVVYSDPHECGQFVDIDTIAVSDCSRVKQNFSITYYEEGIPKIIQGVLPIKQVWLPVGVDTVKVFLVDECKNTSKARILIPVVDNTPPTPVCDEVTQITLDPEECWATIKAKDLDNGSRDNCCEVLHFAVAHMDSISYWRDYWTNRLETECSKAEFWANKEFYDFQIERWINAYVFKDEIKVDECGRHQVVLRVYEACGVPRLDPHIWKCSPHQWFWYNTDQRFRIEHNWNFFHKVGPRDCHYRYSILCQDKHVARGRSLCEFSGPNPKDGGLCYAQYAGARERLNPDICFGEFFDGTYEANTSEGNAPGSYCSYRLYNDCMVTILADDKQAPVAEGLKDITIYCDGAPGWADYADCGYGERYTSSTWPLDIKDRSGSKVNSINIPYGYYGGSDFLGIHVNEDDHNARPEQGFGDPQACNASKGWAPIYCKPWLLLDSFDQAGHQDYASYFEKLLMFDKKTKQTAALKENEFSITDNCLLDKTTLQVSDAGSINGCGIGWISRTWTMKDKCGNEVTATQKIYVKHRSDFEVIFPADKVVTCDFLNRTDTTVRGAGAPVISDDECEQVGVRYKDEVFTIEDSACYKIVRTWTLIDWCSDSYRNDPNQYNHHPDVIVDDRLRANSTDRSCVFRNIKDNGDGYMQYVQIIKVIDEIAPRFTCTDNTTCITVGCDATVNIPVSANDNCTDALDIKIRAEITKPDNTVDRRSNIKAITGTFTEGVYKVKMTANDLCGNETICNMTITVKDCKKPTPYCIDGLATVIMPTNGTVEIWAKDFNRGAEDNCTSKDRLRFSFGTDVTKPNRVLTCADIPNGREALLIVDIYVHDLADNKDLCKVSLKVQDNNSAEKPGGACRDTTAALTTLSNKLSSQHNAGIQQSILSEVNILNQNYPNPFSRKSIISVSLAQPIEGTLNITDLQGRVIKSIKRNWLKGYNEVVVEKSELKSPGIFYYSFQSSVFTASKRMILIE